MPKPDYLYTIITRENTAECDFSAEFWTNHPDWKFYVRTNHRSVLDAQVWVGNGGVTLEEAMKAAEFSLWHGSLSPHPIFPGHYQSPTPMPKLRGLESPTIIKNA